MLNPYRVGTNKLSQDHGKENLEEEEESDEGPADEGPADERSADDSDDQEPEEHESESEENKSHAASHDAQMSNNEEKGDQKIEQGERV